MLSPSLLKSGDEIRVIAPSRSGSIIDTTIISAAQKRLENLGFKVSFGKNWDNDDEPFSSKSILARIEDLHDAFTDSNVSAIFTAIGGHNSNELLDLVDFELIAKNPKIFCGFSDITVLANALLHKCNLVTYVGPHFSSWGMEKGFEYSLEMFRHALINGDEYEIRTSEIWSNDEWYIDQANRNFYNNDDGNIVLKHGSAEGVLIGGNISSFMNLTGTSYCPSFKDKILILEQSESFPKAAVFCAQLESISQQKDFSHIRAILIGRFPRNSDMTYEKLLNIINNNPNIKNIPVIANVNVGHTVPINYFPLGNKCVITTSNQVRIIVRSV